MTVKEWFRRAIAPDPHPYRAQVMVSWTDEAFPRLAAEFDITEPGDHWGYLHPRAVGSAPFFGHSTGSTVADTITRSEIERIAGLARAATNDVGDWFNVGALRRMLHASPGEADFIEALSPSVVLALCELALVGEPIVRLDVNNAEFVDWLRSAAIRAALSGDEPQ